MRICLISREYPPDTGWGGIGTVMYHLGNALARLGHDVHVVSLNEMKHLKHKAVVPNSASADKPGEPKIHRVPSSTVGEENGLFNFCLPVTRPMLDETSALWTKFFQLHQEQPFDVIECPEHFAEGLFPAMARVAPIVVRLHTPHSKLLKERYHNFEPNFDHQVLTMMERMAMVSADALVSPSEDLAGYVAQDLNLPVERISIIRNPVDEKTFTPEGENALANITGPKVLFVGRLEERKGVHFLIEAIPKVLKCSPSARFILIGSDTATGAGNTSVLSELKRSLARHSCSDAVTFISHVPLLELPAYYRGADVCVLPSLYENAPMTAIEALASGKPVVASSAGGTKEYVIENECGLIVPASNSDALADALIKLLTDSTLRESFGRAARLRVEKFLTIEKFAQDSISVYERASETFVRRSSPAVYTGPPERLRADLSSFIGAFEKRLYEMVFTYSLRFRLRHWQKKARQMFIGRR